MLALLVFLSSSRKFDSLVQQYKDQLSESSSPAKEEQAILWALAELARQVDKSVTAEEVESEIGAKINEILERVEIADSVLRKDFAAMQQEFATTKQAVADLIESAKAQIVEDMQQFKTQLIQSLESLVRTSSSAQDGWVKSSYDRLKDTFGGLKSSSMRRSVIFFACFQVLLVLGLVFYKKLDNQLKMFL
jgi:phosphoglycerate-specific signal transduction histidine kinase